MKMALPKTFGEFTSETFTDDTGIGTETRDDITSGTYSGIASDRNIGLFSIGIGSSSGSIGGNRSVESSCRL